MIHNTQGFSCFSIRGGGKFPRNVVLLYVGLNIYGNYQYIFAFYTVIVNGNCNSLVGRGISVLREKCFVNGMF